MLALASDVVKSLGCWPAVLSSCGCPQERRLEVRLALILNAYVAKPLCTHPRMEFVDAIACKTRIKALRDSAAKPGCFDSSMPPADSANAVKPGVLPASEFFSKLHALGLHIKPVEGRTVFFHTPAKSVLQERQQEAVLRKYGAYQPLDLCYEASKPWERFFVSNKEFAAYNRAGMRAEDPTAYKWSASKLQLGKPFGNACFGQ